MCYVTSVATFCQVYNVNKYKMVEKSICSYYQSAFFFFSEMPLAEKIYLSAISHINCFVAPLPTSRHAPLSGHDDVAFLNDIRNSTS